MLNKKYNQTMKFFQAVGSILNKTSGNGNRVDIKMLRHLFYNKMLQLCTFIADKSISRSF